MQIQLGGHSQPPQAPLSLEFGFNSWMFVLRRYLVVEGFVLNIFDFVEFRGPGYLLGCIFSNVVFWCSTAIELHA